MKNFHDFLIQEDLAAALKDEPQGSTAQEAKRLGLTYIGFARYADKTGNVAYVVKNGKLIPFSGREATASLAQKAAGEPKVKTKPTMGADGKPKPDANAEKAKAVEAQVRQGLAADKEIEQKAKRYKREKDKQVKLLNKNLLSIYRPEFFRPEEAKALKDFSSFSFEPINNYLYKGFDDPAMGAPQGPMLPDDIFNAIDELDFAFEESGAPFDYTVYCGLGPRYDPMKMKKGNNFLFRGFVPTSLDHETVTDMFMFTGQENAPLLQLNLMQGQKSIYMDGLTGSGDFETLLPRGLSLNLTDDPIMVDVDTLDASAANGPGSGRMVSLFKCTIIEP